MSETIDKEVDVPLGIIVRRSPGATRWAAWAWRVTAVLPGAGPATWKELRRDGDVVEYHAGTLMLNLHRSETEAYLEAVDNPSPCVFVTLRIPPGLRDPAQIELLGVTANPYAVHDYADTGDVIAERVAMPAPLHATVRAFVEAHHVDEPFVKRQRDKRKTRGTQDGIGDARIRQPGDVFRTPQSRRTRLQ